MPKKTFYHLNIEKRKKVEQALENEFGRTSFEKASISNIIEEAGIPRGSFYQYFEDKEDAITYIMKQYMEIEKQTMTRILTETKGDIFETALRIFDAMTVETCENQKINLYKNIMQELKKNNINLFSNTEEEEIKEMDKLIDTTILNIKEKDEITYIIKIISSITRTASIDLYEGNIPMEEVRRGLKKQIEILKRGMLKKIN